MNLTQANQATDSLPAASPDGKWLAYIGQVSGAFRVHLMELSSGNVRVLTETRDDESPSFAPNSRLLIYATRSQGRDVLMTTSLLIDSELIAVLPESVAHYYAQLGALTVLPLPLPIKLGPFGIITRRGRPVTASMSLLVDTLRNSAG